MKGRRPTSNRLKALRGSEKRYLRNSPKPESGTPTCPTWLGREAKAEWRRVMPELTRLGMVCGLDRGVLVTYCQTWALWREAVAVIAKEGITNQTNDGLRKRHPACAIASDASKTLLRLAGELGLTPLSRQRLDLVPEPAAENDFERWKRGRDEARCSGS
ncbi:MAG: phage terminase small subunit P27 family [bacterium]|nr:phage terminase small subunit P27 family [bacterium]